MSIYKPTNCHSLDELKVKQQLRVGIQGYPGTGKTWAALTFPNPVVVNLDRGLGAHTGRKDVIEVPLYDSSFCRTINPQFSPPKLKDVIIQWLDTEGRKLTSEQTLVFDGNTGLQNAYHKWFEANKMLFITKSGEVNDFKEWTVKKTYFGEVMELFKSLTCNVVYLCHEVDQKDKNGPMGPSYSGKIRPLLTGAFGDELPSHFTDFFRQLSCEKPQESSLKEELIKSSWGITLSEFKKYLSSIPGCTMYYWQTSGDNIFDGKCSSLINCPKFVPANYTTFTKKYYDVSTNTKFAI